MRKHGLFSETKPVTIFGFSLLLVCLEALGTDAPLPSLRGTPLLVQAGGNLLQNPGFEDSGPGILGATSRPWVGEEPGIAQIMSDGQAHSGAQEGVLTGDGSNTGQLMQMFTCTANTDYTASAWIGGTPGASPGYFGVLIPHDDHDGDGDTGFDAGVIVNSVNINNDSSGNYQFYTFTFNSGANTQLFVDIVLLDLVSVIRADDVSITQNGGGPPPPPPPPPPPSSGGLPSPWQDGDVGSVGLAGSASFDAGSGTFTVSGSGADIGGTADSFNYVFQQLSGDGTLIAHVTSLGNTSSGAQAGVMIRETLDTDSAFADMLITPGQGASFQGRSQTGSPNFNAGGPGVSAPYWLRIMRTGDVFLGSTSPDGQTWTDSGSATIPMAQNVWIGLAVVSHDNSTLDTATYDSVSLTGGNTGGGNPAGTPLVLTNQNSGLALDVQMAGTAPGTAVWQWTPNGTGAQSWQLTPTGDGYYFLTNTNSGLDLNVPGASTSPGTTLIIWPHDGGTNSQWQISANGNGTFTLTNRNSGLVLDDQWAGTAPGTPVQQWPSNGTSAQQWIIPGFAP